MRTSIPMEDSCGVYIHVPFCKSKCLYCDFFSIAQMKDAPRLLSCMQQEIASRATHTAYKNVRTVYIGGGTPSVLQAEEIASLLDCVRANMNILPDAEISIEANPDDITIEKATAWKSAGINRVSVGVQSFSDSILQKIARRHTGHTAERAIAILREAGFENITLDIIYGIPTRDDDTLVDDLRRAVATGVQHISAYALTVEPRTALEVMIRKGAFPALDDEDSARQYDIVCQYLSDAGYQRYELSNFAREGYRSRHNSAYWQGVPYMGIGPSAHSYDGSARRWNVASVHSYIEGVSTDGQYWEQEILRPMDRHNEMIMTSLRTSDGIDTARMKTLFGDRAVERMMDIAQGYISDGLLEMQEGYLRLTQKGIFLSDGIEADMFLTEDEEFLLNEK